MFPKSLKGKLLLAVSTLVITSGLAISLLVTHRYAESLTDSSVAQAEDLAHALALEAAEKVLINDRVALQKMLDHQVKSNPALGYLFIVRDGRVLSHTFRHGVPKELISANDASSPEQGNTQEIVSTDGDHYIDIAWPIFGGKAGVLRLGFSESPLKQKVKSLWLQVTFVSLAILVLAIVGCLAFVRRITKPLADLAAATRDVEQRDLETEVRVQGSEEVAALGEAFNRMVKRLREYTTRLENQARELARTHNQTRTFCEIVQEIGSLPTLHEIGPALLKRLKGILVCRQTVLMVFSQDRNSLFVLSEAGVQAFREPPHLRTVTEALEKLTGPTFVHDPIFLPPLIPSSFLNAPLQAVLPIDYGDQILGALVIACPGTCECDLKEVELAGMILNQSAGVINRAILQEESVYELQRKLEGSWDFLGIVGKDPKMHVVYKLIEDIARTDATVLIQGESGTGKELVARAIHQAGDRADKPFVVINCSAYPDTLLESELFGHEKGAFTGAIRQKAGRFEQADGGTVFLDEVGEIPLPAQIKLLRVLQTQSFERLGGERTLKVEVRILAATNKDLVKEVQKGTFREDLFYRLNVIPITLPPLRERRNDIPLLANHFLGRFASQQQKAIQEFSPEAMRVILDHSWPGNVRELENSVEHAVVLAKARRVEVTDLPSSVRKPEAQPLEDVSSLMEETERVLLEKVLSECSWNKKKAARRLGIGRSTLYAKLKRYGIAKPTLQ